MLAFGYAFTETAGGTVSCRYIAGTRATSLHAHGIAKDDNPSTNRYRVVAGPIQFGRHTDRPLAMVRAIEAIRTANGKPVFEWGGRWTNAKDPMHDELDALRADLATGINLATLPAGAWGAYLAFEAGGSTQGNGDPMLGLDIGKPGEPVIAKGAAATALQLMLKLRGHDPGVIDGLAGDKTRSALHNWKVSNGITAQLSGGDGVIGGYEYAVLNPPGGTTTAGVSAAQLEQAIKAHADAVPSATQHPHRHDEGITGLPTP
jgi:hypothetical protein